MNWLRGDGGSVAKARPCLDCRPVRLHVEELESRCLPAPLTPIQVRQAYGFDQVSFSDDGVRADGSGQTIAIVVAHNHPGLVDDLDYFSQYFTLGGSQTLYEEYGPASSYLTVAQPQGTPKNDAKGLWKLEASLDVQWAHAIAPGANILLVQAKSASAKHLINAVNYARHQPGVSVISMSWGSVQFRGENGYNKYFTTPEGHDGGITFVAASGDSGKPGLWPGVSRNVVSVGGTTLQVDAYGNYLGETAWKKSGGGVSAYQKKPTFQSALPQKRRAGPDVAYNGDPSTGFYVYHTQPIKGHTSTWWSVGGTSAGAPQWAALIAIANQGRALEGLPSLDGRSQTLPALYQMPSANFNDIVTGGNGKPAKPGFDLVTGNGTPNAGLIIADLIAYTDSGITYGAVIPLAGGAAPAPVPASLVWNNERSRQPAWSVRRSMKPHVRKHAQAPTSFISSQAMPTADPPPAPATTDVVRWFADYGTMDWTTVIE